METPKHIVSAAAIVLNEKILAGKGIRYAFKGEGNLRSKIRYSTHPTSLT